MHMVRRSTIVGAVLVCVASLALATALGWRYGALWVALLVPPSTLACLVILIAVDVLVAALLDRRRYARNVPDGVCVNRPCDGELRYRDRDICPKCGFERRITI